MKTFSTEEHKVASACVGQTGKTLTMGRSYYEGSRRRASHPPLERRPRPQRPMRKKGQVSVGALSELCTPPSSDMSSPSVSVLSMASLGSSVAGGPPNLPLDSERGRRGCDGEGEGGGGRGGGGGGGIRRSSDGGGGAGDVTPRSSVYSSTSYAASRGFRPPSGGDYSLPHPVAPPRSRGTIVSQPTRGLKKSSSEVMSGKGSTPSRGILKSSSGVLKSQHAEVPLSKSSSGGTAPIAPRVNFSSTVGTSDDPPPPAAPTPAAPTPAAPSKPPSETHTTVKGRRYTRSGSGRLVELLSPTGRTLTRQPEESGNQQLIGRRKAEDSGLVGHIPRTRPPQQESQKSVYKLGRQSQAPEAPESSTAPQPPRKPQPSQPRESDLLKKQHQQEQRQQQQLQKEEKDATPLQHSLKSHQQQQRQQQQQHREVRENDHRQIPYQQQQHQSDHQEGPPLKSQQSHGEGEKVDLLKKEQIKTRQIPPLQRTPTIDIPEPRQRTASGHRNLYEQQLVRAGSLGSGEPAAILEQRRSRSPLRTPGRAHPVSAINEGKYASSVTSTSLPEAGRGEATFAGRERKHILDRNQDVKGSQDTVYSQLSKSAEKSQLISSRPSDATRPIPVVGGPAAAEARTGIIRAAAKAYNENYQSYSFSGYLTKNKRDSTGGKEAPSVKDYTEVEREIKQPPAGSSQRETEGWPSPVSHSSSGPPPISRVQSGKIIVPLTSFVLASKSSEPVTNLDKVVIKQPLSGETAVIKINAAETKETPVIGNTSACHKADQEREKGEGGGQEQRSKASHPPSHPQPGASQHQHQSKDPPAKTTTRDKHASRGPSISLNKRLPPFISGFHFSHGSDKMKGNNEGALLVACRVGEEDQVLRLLKEMTAAGVLDAAVLNQADRAGRTALSYACANAFQRVVEVLTGLPGTDINKYDTDGNTPLHFASQAGHTEVVSHLVNKCNRSVDLDARNALGFTPLMKAALQGRTKIAKILLFAGASPHLRDFGRGMCAVEWARYTGRHVCSELIDSIQKSCSSHIRDRWTSDPDLKSHSSTSINTLGQGDNKESWIKHKIRKAFHKSESKKEFSVVTNLSTMAVCATSPLLPTAVASQDLKPHQVVVPQVQVTEVKVPDCYEDPEDALSRLPPPPPPPILPAEDISSSSSSSKSPKKQPARPASANSTSSTSPPSSPPSSPPASATKPSASPTTPAAATSPSKEESQKDTSVGETRANGAAKTSSPTKVPFSTSKKKK